MNIKDKFSFLEELYLNDNYSEIINYWNSNKENLDFSSNNESSQIAEILSVSFIKQEEYSSALYYVNEYLKYLLTKENSRKIGKDDFIDDLITFYDLKIEIYHRMNKVLREYAYTNKYLLYKQDEDIIRSKEELEEIIYSNYVFGNRILMFLTVGLISLFIWQIGIFSHKYFLIISLIVGSWLILNYVFKRKFRLMFLKIFKYLVLTVF